MHRILRIGTIDANIYCPVRCPCYLLLERFEAVTDAGESIMKTGLIRGLIVILALALWLVWLGWFSARPPLTIDPATLAGDNSVLNYCELPTLDGSGKRADDIPKGNTPGCGYDHLPLPILAACTEPLPPETDDIRGLWRGVSGGHAGHV